MGGEYNYHYGNKIKVVPCCVRCFHFSVNSVN